VIVFRGVPPRLAAPRLVQEAQEPAQVAGRVFCAAPIIAGRRKYLFRSMSYSSAGETRNGAGSGTSSASSQASRSSAGPPGSVTSGSSSDRRGIPRLASTTRHRPSVTESNHSVPVSWHWPCPRPAESILGANGVLGVASGHRVRLGAAARRDPGAGLRRPAPGHCSMTPGGTSPRARGCIG
jgi:hypothetical protein